MKKLLIILTTAIFFSPFVIASDFGTFRYENIYVYDSIQQGDTTEYELIVFDPGFDSWFVTNRKPIWYNSNKYYQSKNYIYVIEWNNRVKSYGYQRPYDNEIIYDLNIDYGKEVNYKLYYYFKYIEQKTGQKFSL